eukprot:11145334-Lingulodinium_polyedra.AAC.1
MDPKSSPDAAPPASSTAWTKSSSSCASASSALRAAIAVRGPAPQRERWRAHIASSARPVPRGP